jgi:hypothetical protein
MASGTSNQVWLKGSDAGTYFKEQQPNFKLPM